MAEYPWWGLWPSKGVVLNFDPMYEQNQFSIVFCLSPLSLVFFCFMSCSPLSSMQHRPASAYNSPFFTTNSGAPVWNNNSSLTVGSRGIYLYG